MYLPLKRLCACLAVLLSFCVRAEAQTIFDIGSAYDRRVIELPMGFVHSWDDPFARPAHGFRYNNSCSLVYSANVLPGEYSIALAFPVGNVSLKPAVSIFDRWPYDPQARRYDLPMGPTVRTMGKRIEYRWHVGVSPVSTSTIIYVTVEVPAGANYAMSPFPHTITVMSPPSTSLTTMERGITFLQGPTNLVLSSGQGAIAYVVERSDPAFDTNALPTFPIPGDLVQNGSFKDGLNHWTPHRDRSAADDVRSFSLEDKTLKIKSTHTKDREGLMQKIGADVSGVKSLILRADVKVIEQTQGGTGPDGDAAPVAIAIGYRDVSGKESGKVFWKGFYALTPEEPGKSSGGQKVPRGLWYRYIFDLTQLNPKPASILYISLEGSGWPAREGWIREVHLIKSGGKK